MSSFHHNIYSYFRGASRFGVHRIVDDGGIAVGFRARSWNPFRNDGPTAPPAQVSEEPLFRFERFSFVAAAEEHDRRDIRFIDKDVHTNLDVDQRHVDGAIHALCGDREVLATGFHSHDKAVQEATVDIPCLFQQGFQLGGTPTARKSARRP